MNEKVQLSHDNYEYVTASTSLVESSPLVKAICNRPVLIPYEILQNALDKNVWELGLSSTELSILLTAIF